MAENFPQELENACKNFEGSMLDVEKCLKPLFEAERSQLIRSLNSLDTAKLDLVAVYAMNSFYWSYLIMHGIDPKNHPIKQELDRIRTYMNRIETIKNKENAPKLAKEAAKRFIRNAMFDSEQKNAPNNKSSQQEEEQNEEEKETEEANDSRENLENVDKVKKKKLKRKAEKVKKSKKKLKKS